MSFGHTQPRGCGHRICDYEHNPDTVVLNLWAVTPLELYFIIIVMKTFCGGWGHHNMRNYTEGSQQWEG